MISKTQISKRTLKKKNPEIVKTINLAKKNNHLDLAKKLSGPRKNYKNLNLDELNEIDGDSILVIGKILGRGEINKKIGIAALDFSDKAKEKLEKAGCDIKSIKQALDNDLKLKGVKIIT